MKNISLLVVGATSVVYALGCKSESSAPPVFGGQAATQNYQQQPLSEAPPEVDTSPCAKPAAPETHAFIDNFEDGDNAIFHFMNREGWLYIAADTTSGTSFPKAGEVRPSRLPESEASPDQLFALHGSAEGYSDWGAVWGTTLRWVSNGTKCPLNASGFSGVRFRAKGKSSLLVKFANPATVPLSNEGKCKEHCWDLHNKRIFLTDKWQVYTVRFSELQQQGWGTPAAFEPARIMDLQFAAKPEDLPLDFWIDDLEFISDASAK